MPWARPGGGFTVLFEAFVMALVKEMPVKAMARLVGEQDTRLWRLLRHYVEEARARADFSGVRVVGLDEPASRRDHHYITLFADLERARLLFAPEGRDAAVLAVFREDLEAHGRRAKQLEELRMDMLPALAESYLMRWYFWAAGHSRLPGVIRATKPIREHGEGVIRWFRSRVSNGMLEAMNSLIQAAKARARGYRTTENFITITYLVCGKLNFSLSHLKQRGGLHGVFSSHPELTEHRLGVRNLRQIHAPAFTAHSIHPPVHRSGCLPLITRDCSLFQPSYLRCHGDRPSRARQKSATVGKTRSVSWTLKVMNQPWPPRTEKSGSRRLPNR